jgi:hypothetical protein
VDKRREARNRAAVRCPYDQYIPEEYFGSINAKGLFTKIYNRFPYVDTATCSAKLICDISLEANSTKVIFSNSFDELLFGWGCLDKVCYSTGAIEKDFLEFAKTGVTSVSP